MDRLEIFQGELKELSKENFERLQGRILDLGFSSPIHVWRHDGHHYILDGTQRTRTLLEMKKNGYVIPPLPVVWVEAYSYDEASRKVLSLASQFGQFTDEGLYQFATDHQIDIAELAKDFRIPEINMADFALSYYGDPGAAPPSNESDMASASVTCPSCNHKFTP